MKERAGSSRLSIGLPPKNKRQGRNPVYPRSSVSGPEIQGPPVYRSVGRKTRTPPQTENWFTIRVSGALLLSRMQERGSRKPENGSSALAGPLTQGKPLEIKFKAPCCCPEAAASEGLLTACNRERGRRLLKKFLIKLLSFHGGDGGFVLLMRSTTTPKTKSFL